MRRILKQVIPWNANDEVEIEVPMGSLHLDIQLQGDDMTIWYLSGTDERVVDFLTFRIVGTGWELPDDFAHNHYWLKTLQHDDYVWHVFLKAPTQERLP
jgi:hypothetical protein